ncbi:hypothetical protein GA0115240_14709 [Streptomyces sp. DvalAA-14]|uniref:putative leader peptide n=1 Tax=unclassified Streptomyces TaxID=2593676 RepID=UPI00081BB228|nr:MULTISPECIES: putative leader peptide [unclassified Streptomyces]MYS23034.1 hypothetical protein [Streptomyces sp. SID4948]SCE26391.1 hypothetical protein GA0115240_14709 [Streptomyces sp. DvalAA-14]
MRAQLRRAVHDACCPRAGSPAHPRAGSRDRIRLGSFHPAAVRVLVPGGPLVRLYGRQHIDLLRVAGALCCR